MITTTINDIDVLWQDIKELETIRGLTTNIFKRLNEVEGACERICDEILRVEDILKTYLRRWIDSLLNNVDITTWFWYRPEILIYDEYKVIRIWLPGSDIPPIEIYKSYVKEFNTCAEAYVKLDKAILELICYIRGYVDKVRK